MRFIIPALKSRLAASSRRGRLRAELVERGFALILDRGRMRRVWLRRKDNLQKRSLIHVAGYNLGLIMRLLTGWNTPRARPTGKRLVACVSGAQGWSGRDGDHAASFAITLRSDPFS